MAKITKDTTIGELVQDHPEAARLLMEKGLHCVGCHFAGMETIEQGAKAHGMSDKDIGELINNINEVIEKE